MLESTQQEAIIFRVALPIPLYQTYDYLAPIGVDLTCVRPGTRLLVPFGNGTRVAYLDAICNQSERELASLKTVSAVLDQTPLLHSEDIELLQWASCYYHHPYGEVINAAFPVQLRRGKPTTIKQERFFSLTQQGSTIDLNCLKRAPKQITVLKLFRDTRQPLSSVQLTQRHKNWRLPLQGLLKKNLLQVCAAPVIPSKPHTTDAGQKPIKANREQLAAIEAVCALLHKFSVFLLEGVTGSGKTEVYMQVIKRVLEQGRQVIVLLPEITLTPQLEMRFKARFSSPVLVFHSRLSESARQRAWLCMQQGQGSILLGTRSALFTPLKHPGLIVLDEEHDGSFKQQEGFRFSARDVAVVRARNLGIPIILGSATPSLESLHNVIRHRYQLLHLSKRAGSAVAPRLAIMDIRNKKLQEGLSEALIKEIKNTLSKQQQVLIFLNRRGYAPTLICHSCGWVAGCQRCDTNLVIHHQEQRLRCHHCGMEQALAQHCPACRSRDLTPLGLGTERVELVLERLFPDEIVLRLDRDTTLRKGAMEQMLEAIRQGTGRIILGTQMLAKGHHFPNVTLVAMLDIDSGLFSIDYHAAEKLAQMIVQVSGRAGRGEKAGKVILQTRHPEHPLLTTLIQGDYRAFSQLALAERQTAGLPPYSYQALLRVHAVDPQQPMRFLDAILKLARVENAGHIEILGPTPSPMARRAGRYRYQMLFQSKKRQALHDFLDWLIPKFADIKASKKVRWSIDVDPIDLY